MDDAHRTSLGQFHTYDFESDKAYQDGLQGMISAGALEGKTDDEKKAWLLQTKVFYYNHVNHVQLATEDILASLTLKDVKTVKSTNVANTESSLGDLEPPLTVSTPEPRTLSFTELKELIEQGKTDQIPNNRVIPNKLSNEMPSQSKAAIRRKPWET